MNYLPTIYIYDFGTTKRGLKLVGNTTRIGYDDYPDFIGFKGHDFLEAATKHQLECRRLQVILTKFVEQKYYDQLRYHLRMYEILRDLYLNAFWGRKFVYYLIEKYNQLNTIAKIFIQVIIWLSIFQVLLKFLSLFHV